MSKGRVIKAFGNLLDVEFEGDICQGEVAFVKLSKIDLKSEVLEIKGNVARIQVFENTNGVSEGDIVEFAGGLLEAELAPGLLSGIYDGLQNPLQKIAEKEGLFLARGKYFAPIDRIKKWDFTPTAPLERQFRRGDSLGFVLEGRFKHLIMIPFSFHDEYTLQWIATAGSYSVDTIIAKVTDSKGFEHSLSMLQKWPIKTPLMEGERVMVKEMMSTGLRTIDTQFPIMKGGTFCTPGPFGAGKTVLQHHLSKYTSVDIVVFTACGERAGEVVEVLREFPHLTDPDTGGMLMDRTVIICNTSSMPVAARESSIYMGITIAEYYRQMGLNVLLLADSTSRWAQALREMSGRLEEIPGDDAFPAYLSSRIAEFYERAGVIALKSGNSGSLTICGAVSPAGGNFEEPVTQATLAVVGAFLGLSRERSDARRYPAVDPIISWSKYIDLVGEQLAKQEGLWRDMVSRGSYFLKTGKEIEKRMEVLGEEGIALEEMITYLKAELYDFAYLQQNAFDKEDAYCPLKRQIPLFGLINRIFNTAFTFDSHDSARQYFLSLQNSLKNMNFIAMDSKEYEKTFKEIERQLEAAELKKAGNSA
ncbi:MAG: V-type ATP synthase subunit A [Chlamydiae bacterium]|nr:V-type ATP synthase subunit A [Chlamydiota bacterium]